MEKQSRIRRFLKNEQGSVIITFALMLNSLILAIALSLDLGRAFMASSAIAGAADAAAVASSVNDGDAVKAREYFLANLPVGTLGITYDYDSDVTHTVDTANNTVSVNTAGFDVPAYLSAGTVGGSSNAANAVGGGVTVGLGSGGFQPADYFFIVDSSGSMGGSSGSGNTKREALEIAIENFIDIVFTNQGVGADGISNYRISLTNYGSSYKNTHPLSDDKATILAQLAPMVAPTNEGTCGGCGLRDSKERIIDETANATEDRNKIVIFLTDGILNQFQTYMPIAGTTPTPVAPNNHPLPPNYNGDVSPYSFGNGPHGMAAKECYSMRNLSVIDPLAGGAFYGHLMRDGTTEAVSTSQLVSLWTVRFGTGAGLPINLQLMEYCADTDQDLFAQTGNDLDQVFAQIGFDTSRIRILE